VVLAGAGWTRRRPCVARLHPTGEPYDATNYIAISPVSGAWHLYDVSAHLDGSRVGSKPPTAGRLLPVLEFRRGGAGPTTQVGVTDHNASANSHPLRELSSQRGSSVPRRRWIGSLVYVEIPRVFGTPLTPFLSWGRATSSTSPPSARRSPATSRPRPLRRPRRAALRALPPRLAAAGVEDRRPLRTSIVSRAPRNGALGDRHGLGARRRAGRL